MQEESIEDVCVCEWTLQTETDTLDAEFDDTRRKKTENILHISDGK